MIRIAAVLLVTVLGTACSSTQLVYRNADLQLEYYAWKTVNTSSAQRHDWQPLLQQTLQQHREQELPLVIAWLDLAARLVGTTGAASSAECLVDNALLLYQRHARLAVELAVPLLAELDAAQVRHLAEYAGKRHRKAVQRYLDSNMQRRKEAREKRFTRRIQKWTGKLNDGQHELIRDALARIPDLTSSWLAQRERKTNTLLAMLDTGSNSEDLRNYLDDWWVNRNGAPQETRQQWRIARDEFVRFMDELATTLTDRQRARLVDRLVDLRTDLASFLPDGQPPADLPAVPACAVTPA